MARGRTALLSLAFPYNRVLFGLLICAGAYLWPPRSPSQATIRWLVLVAGTLLLLSGWRALRHPLLARGYAANPCQTVAALVREWKPKPARRESDYEESLARFLTARLPFRQITQPFGTGLAKCNLAVGHEVLVKLRLGLRSPQQVWWLSDLVRLLHRHWKKPLLVVLVGETEEDLLHDLQRSLWEYDDVEVVTKELEPQPSAAGEE